MQVATKISFDFWTCELAIPWSSLPFVKSQSPIAKSLRINFCRNRHQVDKGVTHWAWSPTFGWFHTPERFGVGIFESGKVIVTQVQLPRYFDESKMVVKLRNKSAELKKVKVAGQEVVLQPESESQVQLIVSTSVGEHRRRIELSWDNEVRSFEVAYAIPEPLRLVSPIVLANERGEAVLPLVINMSSELLRKSALVVEVNSKRIRLPLTSAPLQFRCPLKSSLASVRLWLDNVPEWTVTAKLFSPR
ncbi:hypothetical protein HRbin17_00384 [bacterium HR17]|uniref:Uncharacterized protein n=1 Tax=Candidatus Fervidibacter japonicus TaxID=2035412 RepID=A0A2H5X9M1_9BACT|nr:hypothetical protein HRbin17_00384 [bacterium HR17]